MGKKEPRSLTKKARDLVQDFVDRISQNKQTLKIIKMGLVTILLTFFAVASYTSVLKKSATLDESKHLLRGVTVLKYGDYRLVKDHPVIPNILTAIPQLFNDKLVMPSTESDYWKKADKDRIAENFILINSGRTAFTVNSLNKSRIITTIVITLAAGAIFLLMNREFGYKRAIIFLFMFALSPNIMAHSRFVTNDAWVTVSVFIATFLLYRYFKKPDQKRFITFSLAAAAALLTKYSSVFIFFFWTIAICYFEITRIRAKDRSVKSIIRALMPKLLTLAGICFIIIFAVYSFRFKTLASTHYANANKLEDVEEYIVKVGEKLHMPIAESVLMFIYHKVPFPFPEYVAGFSENVLIHNVRGHSAFLLLQYSRKGWWYYFIVAYLIKVPVAIVVGTLILLDSTIHKIIKVKSLKQLDIKPETIFAFVPLGFFATVLISNINIGFRHILLVMPFVYFYLSKLILKAWKGNSLIKTGIVFLGIWYILANFSIYPHYLEYFNEFVGGPENGHKFLLDSNLDWRQDEILVQEYIAQLPQDKNVVYLDYVYDTLDEDIEDGIYIIDADNLMGRAFGDRKRYAWLRMKYLNEEIKPIDMIGYTHLVFEIDD